MVRWFRPSGRSWSLLAGIVSLVTFSACGSAPLRPSEEVAFTVTDQRVGTGAEATVGKILTVNYTGWLYDASKSDKKGAQFDASAGRGPFTFQLGVGEVIRGWDQGLVGMRVGGLRQLIVPSSMAYGTRGRRRRHHSAERVARLRHRAPRSSVGVRISSRSCSNGG